ncbi:hypothetical protein Syun_003953 [Stephania yunnanensis]|uniref:Uncharacterized protein n=1 Tax=Stephania yunnanensis TaxID=152371 RepID=A0AAP0L2E6_9MAGN
MDRKWSSNSGDAMEKLGWCSGVEGNGRSDLFDLSEAKIDPISGPALLMPHLLSPCFIKPPPQPDPQHHLLNGERDAEDAYGYENYDGFGDHQEQ